MTVLTYSLFLLLAYFSVSQVMRLMDMPMGVKKRAVKRREWK